MLQSQTTVTRRSSTNRFANRPRIDGRSAAARRIRVVEALLLRELTPRRRLLEPERVAIKHCAEDIVLAEIMRHRAIMGEIDPLTAVRASSAAERSRRALLQAIVVDQP